MYTLKTFNNPQAMADYLNGAVISKPLPTLTIGLHGLTLIITTSGDKTVTFSDASGVGLSQRAILDQIRAADASLASVILRDYGYDVKQPSLVVSTAGQVVKSTGTANALLGFSATADAAVAEVAMANIVMVDVQVQSPQYSVLIHT